MAENPNASFDYNYNPNFSPKPAGGGTGLAIAGVVLGGIGIIATAAFSWVLWGIGALVGLICGIVGLVLSIISRKQNPNGSLAIIGLVLGILAIVIGTICLISCAACYCANPYRQLYDALSRYY